VNFEPFVGIAPPRYRQVFEKGKRKDKFGSTKKWSSITAEPIIKQFVAAYLALEAAQLDALDYLLNKAGMAPKGGLVFSGSGQPTPTPPAAPPAGP
jgi:cytidine deaminase